MMFQKCVVMLLVGGKNKDSFDSVFWFRFSFENKINKISEIVAGIVSKNKMFVFILKSRNL